jgi:uncharacterized membrane protein YphA (DoxX/SURF4 family)
MRYLVPLGRLLYALIFAVAGFGHFTRKEIAYAAAQGNPSPVFWCQFPASWPSLADSAFF